MFKNILLVLLAKMFSFYALAEEKLKFTDAFTEIPATSIKTIYYDEEIYANLQGAETGELVWAISLESFQRNSGRKIILINKL